MGTPLNKRYLILFAAILLLVLIATRAPHMKGPIDDPHSWRQCDTAYYALTFHEGGLDPFHPKVCWMGTHEVLILEFPLPEMMMALVYDVFGYDLLYARILTLLVFAVSALFFFLTLRYLFDDIIAMVSTAVYCILPLSLFYSRAVHIDFYAVCLAHAMFYYFIRGYEEDSPKLLAVGALTGSLGFLVKGPYVFYFALPLAVFVLMRFKKRRALQLALAYTLCLLVFVLWRWYVNKVNGMAPDWHFIPGYTKFVDMWGRYFGPLAWRWDGEYWRRLLPRFRDDVASVTGLVLLHLGFVGSIFARKWYGGRAAAVALTWLLAVLGYILLFFSLNVWHNYYQIPSTATCALFIGIGLVAMGRILKRWIGDLGWIAPAALLALLAFDTISNAEANYYDLDETRIEAGSIIAANTDRESVIITAPDVRATNFEDPRLLFRARRRGWSINRSRLTEEIVRRLARDEGATHLALVVRDDAEVGEVFGMKSRSFHLETGPWKVVLVDLRQARVGSF